ncbi:hypothetical protein ES705_10525 [subsurface metagenome]
MRSIEIGIFLVIVCGLLLLFRRRLEQMTRRMQKTLLPKGMGWGEDIYEFARIVRVVVAIIGLIIGFYIIMKGLNLF